MHDPRLKRQYEKKDTKRKAQEKALKELGER